jgi:predicted permease
MRHLWAWFLRLGGLFGKERRERELAEELKSNLALHIEDNLSAGMTPEEARRQALIKLGGIEQTKEQYRDRLSIPLLETLIQDLRFGLRQLRRNPGFTAVAIITLALGIGATTAIFSVVSAVVLRPLPFPAPHQLVEVLPSGTGRNINRMAASYPDFLDWRKQNGVFTDMAAYTWTVFALIGHGGADSITGTAATPSLFSILRVSPLLGRTFTWHEESAQASPVAMISERLWRRRFAADPALIGKTIDLNKRAFTVVGVLPSSFHFPFLSIRSDIWVPITKDPTFGYMSSVRADPYLRVIARLKPRVSVLAAQAQMGIILARLPRAYPKADAGWRISLAPLRGKLIAGLQEPMLVLLGAVLFVVLIACANVANLLLARATTRQKELAVRAALGASRRRLIRQVLSESVVLSLVGGGLGLLLAFASMGALVSLVPIDVPRIHSIRIDGWVLTFTIVLALIAGILAGLAPAFYRPQTALSEALKEGARGSGAGPRRRVRGFLVICEVALAMVLLAGAGLLIRSFIGLDRVDPGFDPHHVFEAGISLPPAAYKGPAQWGSFRNQLLGRVRSLPGVKGASATLLPPLSGNAIPLQLTIQGRAPRSPGNLPSADYSDVGADYFRVMKIPLLRGRLFTRDDTSLSRPVAIINEAMAQRYFPGQDPIGHGIVIHYFGPLGRTVRDIVGIVGDVKVQSLGEAPAPLVYTPLAQAPVPIMFMLIRTVGSPSHLADVVRAQVRQIDPTLPLSNVTTAARQLRRTLAEPQFHTSLLGTFAGLALILAMVGIYGVISYSVSQRTHEIGVRMALGAQRGDVLKLVVGQGIALALIGVAIGIAAALGLTRFLGSMLYGVKPTDPPTFVAASLMLMGVALLACYIPARRATKVDPMTALRYE